MPRHDERVPALPDDIFKSDEEKRPVVKMIDGHWVRQYWVRYQRKFPTTGEVWRMTVDRLRV